MTPALASVVYACVVYACVVGAGPLHTGFTRWRLS